MTDHVNHPKHYSLASAHLDIEPIQLCSAYNFCLGNAMKYILRAPFKGREIEDYKKAVWYLEYQLEHSLNGDIYEPLTKAGHFKPSELTVALYAFGQQNEIINELLMSVRTGEINKISIENCIRILKERIEKLENERHEYEFETTERIRNE